MTPLSCVVCQMGLMMRIGHIRTAADGSTFYAMTKEIEVLNGIHFPDELASNEELIAVWCPQCMLSYHTG